MFLVGRFVEMNARRFFTMLCNMISFIIAFSVNWNWRDPHGMKGCSSALKNAKP